MLMDSLDSLDSLESLGVLDVLDMKRERLRLVLGSVCSRLCGDHAA